MAAAGFFALIVAFVATLGGLALLGYSSLLSSRGKPNANLSWFGRVCLFLGAGALTVCCIILVIAFFSGDNSISYVVHYRSNSSSPLAWLYVLSGLWAGRQGSLLFWAWLISLFGVFVALRNRSNPKPVDDCALSMIQLVMAAFLGVLLFSSTNMPFAETASSYFDSEGSLSNGAELWGLNPLLEHWAMAIHPPTLFVGYAGMTIPFAYALAAMLCGDDSDTWVLRVGGITSFAWLFLGFGIGLGAVWAYVVLGWGGYWGWDPVENASLLSWLAAVALMHSFTLYRKRGEFKRWSVVCACITFMFVIVGTFISRSGIVQSVHAFEGDTVSLVLFAVLIAAAFASAIFGAFGRRKSFAVPAAGAEEAETSFFSRSMMYYLNNVLMMVASFLLMYLTISSALPTWMPFGGVSVSTVTYNAIARPLTIIVMCIVAVCPLLGWHKTDRANFLKRIRIPAICAAVIFVTLVAFWATNLLPAYELMLGQGGSSAYELSLEGAPAYYNALAILGFAAASVVLCNSLYMLIKMLKAGSSGIRSRLTTIGGFFAHASLAIIVIGLIGSGMFVTERTGYLDAGGDDTAAATFEIGEYTITPTGDDMRDGGGDGFLYSVGLDVSKGDTLVAHVEPTVQVDKATQQQKQIASVIATPTHDLFIVYRGVNSNMDYSMDVRINPLISFVWVGFGLLMIGTLLALLGKRTSGSSGDDEPVPAVARAEEG